jgi:hypothetical protein
MTEPPDAPEIHKYIDRAFSSGCIKPPPVYMGRHEIIRLGLDVKEPEPKVSVSV